MKRIAILALLSAAVLAAAPAGARVSAAREAPPVDARAFLLVDGTTGAVLAESNAGERLPIASITKLMTVRVALQRLRVSQIVRASKGAAAVGESSIGLDPGERISVHDLLEGALVQSANDAADALADAAFGGDRHAFIDAMNVEATRLGLDETHYVRPDGLDAAGHLSSARDVTRLARIEMRNPLVRAIVRQRSATIAGGTHLATWNDLLTTFPGVFGVKTGHTDNAGWCEVVAATRDGVTLYATILGAPTRSGRDADLAALLRYGFSFYGHAPLVRTGQVYASVRTEFGRHAVRLVARHPVNRVVRVDWPLAQTIVVPAVVALPVRKGQRLGRIEVRSNGVVVARETLVAAESEARPNIIGRAEWYTARAAHNLIRLP